MSLPGGFWTILEPCLFQSCRYAKQSFAFRDLASARMIQFCALIHALGVPIHALVLSKPGNGCPSLLGFRFAFLLVTLVVQLAALAKAEGHLEPGTLEVEIQGDEGEALLLEGGAEFLDLAAVGQQFAHPQRFVVEEAASMAVG